MIKKEEIFVNESHWRNMSDNDLNAFVDKIFAYYRENGFPYYSTDIEIRKKDFNKLMNYNRDQIIVDNVINQSMHGLGLAWSYFPHSFNVKCNDMLTPYEAFMNDEIFMNVIRKRLKIGTYISDSGIRKILKIYTGVQAVSNFRPTAAAAIYDKFAKNGVVWDMSGGWGGRLLGAIASDVSQYVATEPSTLTCNGLRELAKDFGGSTEIKIFGCGSENCLSYSNYFDLCFTSPPYFDLEKYSDESTQSYIKFNNINAWVKGYLTPTFDNCYRGLKKNKYMLINIADVKNKTNVSLEETTINVAKSIGFKYTGKLLLALSNVNMRNKTNVYKYEPIFMFLK